jgi:hypothetical protein
MFDWYRPLKCDACPACGAVLDGWQGKHGPNALLVWEQGRAEPVDQLADDDWKPALAHRWKDRTLPPSFEIHTMDEHDHWVSTECSAPDGVWSESKILEARALFERGRRVLWRADRNG